MKVDVVKTFFFWLSRDHLLDNLALIAMSIVEKKHWSDNKWIVIPTKIQKIMIFKNLFQY